MKVTVFKECVADMKDTKTWILDAAMELFSEKGFAQTTTKAIAEYAGVSESTFFRIYKTKAALLGDLLYIMTPGPVDMPMNELTNGENLEKDFEIFLYHNALLHVKHLPVFRVAMHVENIYDSSRFSKIKGLITQMGGYFEHLAETGKLKEFDYYTLAEHVNSLALIKASEFINSEAYGISVEQSAKAFATQYANLFARLLKP